MGDDEQQDEDDQSDDSDIEIGEAQIIAEAGLDDDVEVKDLEPEMDDFKPKVKQEEQEDQEEQKVKQTADQQLILNGAGSAMVAPLGSSSDESNT